MFDADTFLSTPVEGEMATDYTPVPEGEYQAVITDVKIREAKTSVIMDVYWDIDDASVAEATGRDKNNVRQSIFLDVTASGGLDLSKGSNVQLGKLRAALGQNTGAAWSPSQLSGNVATIRTANRMYEGNTYTDVKGVVGL